MRRDSNEISARTGSGYDGPCEVAVPAKSLLLSEIGGVEQATADLGAAITRMEDRLNPVLSPTGCQQAAELRDNLRPARSAAIEGVTELGVQIVRLVERIDSITARLDT